MAASLFAGAVPALSQGPVSEAISAADRATYADLVGLAERSDMVIKVEIRRQIAVEPERAPGLEPGFTRLYIEARTLALISGSSALGESLVFLVDVPLNAKGKPEKYKKREMILFADQVPGRRGSVRLTGKQAMLDYSPALEARLRPILTDLAGRDVAPLISGIGDALAVQGTLVGESETQIFVETKDRSPVSITVLRRPGQPISWGVSWGEIIDSAARAPARETLRWYRLACSLPDSLPSSANLARDPEMRRLAEADYRFVLEQLGQCSRVITQADEA
ncbi:MAG: hypothetical protein ABJK59_09265 [Erythrobacter sp.]|uniref:hypothetical protein n=1 Tax=Erythrobacter sp. TaxID=1042 RepID=UPI003298D7D5